MSSISSSNQITQPKLLTFLSMLVMTFLLSGTVLGFRLVHLGPFIIPGSTVIYPFTYFFYAIITEVYGYKTTRMLIWQTIALGFIFAFLIKGVDWFPAPPFWQNEYIYKTLFSNILIFTFFGSLGMAVSEFLNSYIVAKMKILTQGKFFSLRALGASFVGEAAHVLIFGSAICYLTVPKDAWCHFLFSTYIYRLAYGVVAVGPATAIAFFVRKFEKSDVYDTETNFSPLRFLDLYYEKVA